MKLSKLTTFLDRLDASDMHYTLTSVSEGAVMVGVTVPDQRWEIEFMADGEIEVEVFESGGEIQDFSIVSRLFERDADA
ncbi:MAG: hypothetical protein GY716_13290 [bacterium]|nr:hypothetical protein [bacterium]